MIPIEFIALPDEGNLQVLWSGEDGSLVYVMYHDKESFLSVVPDGQSYADAMGW